MKTKKMKPYIKQENEIVNSEKLLIKDIIIKKEFVKIIIEHWDYKYIQHIATIWDEDKVYYEFGYDSYGESTFDLVIPYSFYGKYNLDDCVYMRQDKYETELLFEVDEE